MNKGVSIIIPCYNKEKTIEMTVNSILNQSLIKNKGTNFVEIICIDDCSTDGTKKKLQKLSAAHYNIKTIFNPKNAGVFASRLNGIKASTREYVSFIDPDDYVDETYYEELYKAAKKSGADITQTPSVIKEFGNNRSIPAGYYMNMPEGTFKISPENFTRLIRGNWLTLWNRMFKREPMMTIAYYPPYYINFLEDVLIYLSVFVSSSKLCNVHTKGFYHYNLSMDVDHLSRKTGNEQRSVPTSMIFQLLNSYLLESKNMAYYDCIVKFRSVYISHFCKEYGKCFECWKNKECFGSCDEYYNQREAEYIRKVYIELLKSNY